VPANHDVLELILEKIRESRNFDFRNYKRATLRRRVERRMADRRCRTMRDYLDLLERGPEEFDALISGMLIKVTTFFRDPEAWEVLRKRVLPVVLEAKQPGDEFRAWSVGCATGEETYTIAILLAEALGAALGHAQVKVFGTDVDEAAVTFARRGIYSADQVQHVSKERLARWFTPVPEGWAVRKEIRRLVVFGVNNLVSDAPISRLDLLACRNVFIYLDANLQKRILSRFHYALRPRGVLMLGKSELIPFAAKVFRPVDLQKRIYVREDKASRAPVDEDRLTALVEQEDVTRAIRETRDELTSAAQLHRDVVSSLPLPIVTTTLDGVVTSWNAAAGRLWRRPESEAVGKRLTALALPGMSGDLLVEKTAAVRDGKIERAIAEGVVQSGTSALTLSIEVSMLHSAAGEGGLVYVAHDVTDDRRVQEELRVAREDREKAVEDLQTANEELQSSNEELETTNEELQSANEELQTTNEELQSTNEELETTNEELQSTNAELDTTNRELAARSDELNVLSFYQRTIIRSLSAAVVVLDPQGRITLWNLAAERLLGLTENEALGQLLWTLRIPVVGRALMKQVRRNLSRRLALRVEDLTYERGPGGRGHAALAAIPLVDEDRVLGGVVLLEDTTRAVQLAEERARERLRARPERASGGGGRRDGAPARGKERTGSDGAPSPQKGRDRRARAKDGAARETKP
jgi:two-component system CheB/CheR fusion protein